MENASIQWRAPHASHRGRRIAWITLLMIVLAGVAMVSIPVWIIQPFRPQSSQGLEISYALRRWSPAATLVVSAMVLALVVRLWPGAHRWWRKSSLMIAVVVAVAAAWFARQNHFEWMFKPLPEASYAKAGEAAFVADTDMVMAVDNNGESVAYPIRQMAYHHVVQDVIGGTPVVATY